jgi:hypothetical protein
MLAAPVAVPLALPGLELPLDTAAVRVAAEVPDVPDDAAVRVALVRLLVDGGTLASSPAPGGSVSPAAVDAGGPPPPQ